MIWAADALSPSLLKRLLTGEGGGSRMQNSGAQAADDLVDVRARLLDVQLHRPHHISVAISYSCSVLKREASHSSRGGDNHVECCAKAGVLQDEVRGRSTALPCSTPSIRAVFSGKAQ